MNSDLAAILTAIEAATPDGRWAMLQRWLVDYPEIHDLAYATPEEAFDAIRDRAAKEIEKQFNIPGAIVLNSLLTGAMKARIESAIQVLQQCYQERNISEKEIKNVRADRKIGGKQGAKNPRRVISKAKRTDQA